MTTTGPSPTAAVAARDLRFTYPRGVSPAVDGLTFEVAAGEVFGFLGPSGAGKTTTQKILTRLLAAYGGEVRVFGRELSTWGDDYFERVGVGFEQPALFGKLTAAENLRLFAALYAGPVAEPEQLLAAVGLAEAAGTRAGELSRGMQTRLGVARALLHRPDLVFLDEPTSGLDPVNARLVKDLVRAQQRRGAAVFLTTHDLHTADELCDRVAFIVDGRLAAVGSPKELRYARSERQVRVEYRDAGGRGERLFPLDGLADDPDFLALLRSGTVEAVHTLEASLEDVFVELTGRRLV